MSIKEREREVDLLIMLCMVCMVCSFNHWINNLRSKDDWSAVHRWIECVDSIQLYIYIHPYKREQNDIALSTHLSGPHLFHEMMFHICLSQ